MSQIRVIKRISMKVLKRGKVIQSSNMVDLGKRLQITQLNQALLFLKPVLSKDQILTDESSIKDYEKATYKTSVSILAILKPKNLIQLQQCLKIANRFSISVYTISRGKNWGLGSKTPTQTNVIILELSLMNQILDYSEDDGYLVVEPGVSFQQCYDFLNKKNSPFFINVIGGPPQASVIGNIIERGDGIGPLSERMSYVSNFEVLLSDGSIINSGFGSFTNSKIKHLFPHGIGPNTDGLFSQSNLGIVVKMTIWLSLHSKHFTLLLSSCNNDQQLISIISNIKTLYLNGTLKTPFYIWNDYKQVANVMQYPWKDMKNETPLNRQALNHFKSKYNFGKWNMMTALYPSSKVSKFALKYELKSCLKGNTSKKLFLDKFMFSVLRVYFNLY